MNGEARNRAGIPLTDGHLRRVTPVNDETYVINDPLCECGSTITVRRLKAPTWGKPADSIRACCTDHPREGHPLPEQVCRGGGDRRRTDSTLSILTQTPPALVAESG